MIRRILFPAASDPTVDTRDGFVHRGESPSRIECFSDCVFAFALTLLVVSLEVPRTFDALLATLPGFFGFAASFALLMVVWRLHSLFFRRYGLQDRMTTTLNSMLLFVLMFYVYPLRFLSSVLVAVATGFLHGGEPLVRLADGTWVKPLAIQQLPHLMMLYLAGWAAMFAFFTLMHAHAYRERARLALSPYEVVATRVAIEMYATITASALAGVALCALGSGATKLIPLLAFVMAFGRRRQARKLKDAALHLRAKPEEAAS